QPFPPQQIHAAQTRAVRTRVAPAHARPPPAPPIRHVLQLHAPPTRLARPHPYRLPLVLPLLLLHPVPRRHVRRSPSRKNMDEALRQAMREALFCEQILAKGSQNVVLETLRDASGVETWAHYPQGDVYDPESGGQWYYHCHDTSAEKGEHGHFHCFLRPKGGEGPIHHLIAIGVDPFGRLVRLFTVNQWVVADNWADAETVISLLP